MAKQAESTLSGKIRAALNARGHRVWKNWGNQMVEIGISDLTGFARDGRGVALEVKLPGKEHSGLSPGQKRFLATIVDRAPLGVVAVVSSVEQAIACVEEKRFAKVYSDGFCYMVPFRELTDREAAAVIEASRDFPKID